MSMEATLATWELKKSQVNSREKFFLLCLARRAGEDHTCWPSIARMVEDTGFDRKTLIDVRQALMGRSMLSYTGRMVGRSGQIPEMRLDYVQRWEEQRNSPRLNDKDETVDKLMLTSPKNGTGTSTGNGTGTSPKNGTLNSSLEYKNRNKKLLSNDEQKKAKAFKTRADYRTENEKKHSFTQPNKAPIADVTKQSTSWNPEKQNKTSNCSPEAVEKAMMSLPRHMRPKKYRDANPNNDQTIKATELPTGTAVPTEVPSSQHAGNESAEHALDGQSYLAPELRNGHRVMETRSTRSYLEKVGLACEDNRSSA